MAENKDFTKSGSRSGFNIIPRKLSPVHQVRFIFNTMKERL